MTTDTIGNATVKSFRGHSHPFSVLGSHKSGVISDLEQKCLACHLERPVVRPVTADESARMDKHAAINGRLLTES